MMERGTAGWKMRAGGKGEQRIWKQKERGKKREGEREIQVRREAEKVGGGTG